MILRLQYGVHSSLEQAARFAVPREACGILLGVFLPAGSVDVRAMKVLPNQVPPSDQADRFRIDPMQIVEADRAARSEGLRTVGAWHSHPAGPAEPSELDHVGALGGWIQVIVGLPSPSTCEMRAWRRRGEVLEEVSIEFVTD